MDDFQKILSLLAIIHAKTPGLRICQILGNVTPSRFRNHVPGGISACDNYYLDDKELRGLLERYIVEHGQ